ncbi:hypothetical protein MKZ38_006876 [Zalerion maritima]|uniref:Uncharacterized protein n=1 Tax=Zalerion maritima TaxID=339359 RepID=A0AAD5RIE9_9PEZI|nr:hypothetical protein MKZ38_006876 [Zalerion maritima]
MSRGHETKGRRERRHRDDRRRDPRDGYAPPPRDAYPQEYLSEDVPPPEYEPEPEPQPHRRSGGREKAPPLRRRGLNDDYYNAAEVNDSSRRDHRDHRDRRDRHSRRSEDRYDSRRYSKPTKPEEEDEYERKPRRRAKTQVRSQGRHRNSRRHDDYSDEESSYDSHAEERPAKPSRRKSFMNAIGIGKSDTEPDHGRRRSPDRSPSRGRRGNRDYGRSPSPPSRRGTAYGGGKSARPGGGLKRSNTNWQKVAGSAMKAGASAAFQARHDPSPWVGPKGIRVATAAIGAAVADNFIEEKNPRRSRSRGGVKSQAAKSIGEAALRHIMSSSGSRGRSRGHHY